MAVYPIDLREKRIPKPGELIQVVAAEPTEDRPYYNGDVFEVGYAWNNLVEGEWEKYGGVTTVQNIELYNREYVLLDELVEPNPHAEVFGVPMGAEFGSDEYEFLTDLGAYRIPNEACVMPDEPTVVYLGGNIASDVGGDKVDHPSHYKQGKFETIEIIEEITQGYEDGYVAYAVGNAIKYLARAPFKHDTPEEDLRKAAKYIEFALKRLAEAE